MRWPAIALVALALAACDAGAPTDAPPGATPGATTSAGAGGGIDFSALQAQARLTIASRLLVERGFQCGWHAGWMRTVKDARHIDPGAFRSRAVGGAFGFGLVMLVAGVTATMFLAWLLPRLARRKKKVVDAPGGLIGGQAGSPPGWYGYFKELGVRFLQRLGRLLHVELFDPVLASQRTQSIHTARDVERQLAVAIDAVTRMSPHPSPPAPPAPPVADDAPHAAPAPDTSTDTSTAGEVRFTLEGWRAEVQALRKKLEAPGGLPRELSADVLTPRLDNIQRMARDVRVGLERALVGGGGRPLEEGAWRVWRERLAQRPKTPHEQAPSAALPPWVRPVGLGGLAAVSLAVPLMALWMAAGAFPLFFAFLLAAGGLGAVLVARVHLHRAGRLPLLPGFADRVARWLTSVGTLAFVLMVLSSWMSSESGLDLGDPPPVPVPDPVTLQAPALWPSSGPTPGLGR
ncbi:MAG: hypothetical protein IT385_06010 [Deltaproteobacteria bacterium]|nr:hypothetical protein [Deltaproteobacteria bacterium]